MTPQKPREFWIDPTEDGDDGEIHVFQALSKHPSQGPLQWQASLIHVIEHSAYRKAVEALRKYAKGGPEISVKSFRKNGEYARSVIQELGEEL